eukprot:4620969-Amphidinium_carterae.1
MSFDFRDQTELCMWLRPGTSPPSTQTAAMGSCSPFQEAPGRNLNNTRCFVNSSHPRWKPMPKIEKLLLTVEYPAP